MGVCAVALAALTGLGGCFDNDPGMQERYIRAQVELQEQKQKLADTEAALAKAQAALKAAQAAPTPGPVAAATPAAPSKEQLNDGYIAAAKAMRDQLSSELSGYTIVKCTLYEVNTVAALPYTSQVAVALRSDKGQQYKIEMPVGADATGKWKFPTTQEILDNISKNPPKTVATNTTQNGTTAGNPVDGRGSAPFQPRGQEKAPPPPPVSGMGDGNVDTVTLNWSNSQTRSSSGSGHSQAPPVPPPNPAGGTGSGSRSTAEQRPAAQPPRVAAPPPAQPASQPAPAMPADQSVLVTF